MILSVNGVAVAVEAGASGELAAARELLRQRAVATGLLLDAVEDDEDIKAAIEALIEREVATPLPSEAECRRYYEQHPQEFQSGDLVHARHILFQVTSGVDIRLVLARAEEALNELLREPDRFTSMARELSNCPSGEHGGNLGQIARGDTVPEFDKALFRLGSVGLLPELVRTRYGFHIVTVDNRILGTMLPFEIARNHIARRLQAAVEESALRQYVSLLAGQADITGVDLDASASPLVQ